MKWKWKARKMRKRTNNHTNHTNHTASTDRRLHPIDEESEVHHHHQEHGHNDHNDHNDQNDLAGDVLDIYDSMNCFGRCCIGTSSDRGGNHSEDETDTSKYRKSRHGLLTQSSLSSPTRFGKVILLLVISSLGVSIILTIGRGDKNPSLGGSWWMPWKLNLGWNPNSPNSLNSTSNEMPKPTPKNWTQCLEMNHFPSPIARQQTNNHQEPNQLNDPSNPLNDPPTNSNPNTPNAPRTPKLIEPFWLPAYPTSLPGDKGHAFSQFLAGLTGIPTAARNYYRSSKTLKRCHSTNVDPNVNSANSANNLIYDGVTCEMLHPIVPCERPPPSHQHENFSPSVILALRNPISAFAAFHQEKANKYHGVKGQVERGEWVKFRDEFVVVESGFGTGGAGGAGGTDGDGTHSDSVKLEDLESPLFDEWKHFITEWRSMDPYHIVLYLPYEDWTDEVKGPKLAERLGRVLEGEGFPVLPSAIGTTGNGGNSGIADGTDSTSSNADGTAGTATPLECMWYQRIHQTIQAEQHQRTLEGWYTPEYTTLQKRVLVRELNTFIEELMPSAASASMESVESLRYQRPGDEELIGILKGYRDDILKSL